MKKKIKITETQYDRLLRLMVETPFDTMTKTTIKDGDIISITWKGSKNNFKVVNNTNGQIVMDNIDKGSTNINYRYFMVYTSLNGDDMQLRRVHKVKEADKLNDFKQWSPIIVKDITDIQVIRDGEVIDRVDPVSPTAEKQQNKLNDDNDNVSDDFINMVDNNLAIILNQLDEGKGLKLILNNAIIIFCCISKNNGVFNLEISDNKSIPSINKWDNFILDIKGESDTSENLYLENKDIIKTTDDGKTFSLKFKVQSGEKESQVWILGNESVAITKSCDDMGDDDENEKQPKEESLKQEAKEVYDEILADKDMQKAFYSQPTFWQTFMAELKGEKNPGTGIITVLNIVKKYNDKKLTEKIGGGFTYKKNSIVKFVPTKPIEILYNTKKGIRRTFSLQTIKPMDIRVSDDKKETGLVLRVNLPNDKENTLEIVVFDKTETPDVKECRITIGRISPSTNNFIVLSNSITADIKFLKSEGYNPENEENN